MDDQDYARFGREFLHAFLERGFGALPKREIELLVFDQLSLSPSYSGKSNYEISALLKIPESRVKALRLASALKYRDLRPDAILAGIVARLTEGGQIPQVADGKIEISLEDPVEHREMSHFLKSKGGHAEYALNSEVVRISPTALFELMLEHSGSPMDEFDAVIREGIDDADLSASLLKDAASFRTKFKRFREANLKPEFVAKLVLLAAPTLMKAAGA